MERDKEEIETDCCSIDPVAHWEGRSWAAAVAAAVGSSEGIGWGKLVLRYTL